MSTSTDLTLTTDRGDSALVQTTRELAQRLERAGVAAGQVELDDGRPGGRGDAFSIGQLAIDLVTSGAVTALLECLKAFLERDSSLRVKIGGVDVEITSHNVDDAATKAKIEAARSKHHH